MVICWCSTGDIVMDLFLMLDFINNVVNWRRRVTKFFSHERRSSDLLILAHFELFSNWAVTYQIISFFTLKYCLFGLPTAFFYIHPSFGGTPRRRFDFSAFQWPYMGTTEPIMGVLNPLRDQAIHLHLQRNPLPPCLKKQRRPHPLPQRVHPQLISSCVL